MARKVALSHRLLTRVPSGESEQQEAPETTDPTKHGKKKKKKKTPEDGRTYFDYPKKT